ncbi:hypothetical protein [Sphingomonas morindae]|uniref:PH domain-containing protein n=1 Tax=Sphingomonas morindae TaxID=1541170 RepID=A0ABY4X4D0_9SPHN|nr:hypothetical protein [Sphingomonas morindae]USI71744.1 hypothetical protein LHA26_10445 [Sphingomonas morindae]
MMMGSVTDRANGCAAAPAPDLRFAYHRGLVPLFALLLGLALAVAGLLHCAAALLWPWMARPLALFDAAVVVGALGLVRSFRVRPVLVLQDRLVLHAGWLARVSLPLACVRLRPHWSPGQLARPDLLDLALVGAPNIWLDIEPPLRRRGRLVRVIVHRLDDREAFVAALVARGRAPAVPR